VHAFVIDRLLPWTVRTERRRFRKEGNMPEPTVTDLDAEVETDQSEDIDIVAVEF
jgi:hypothetical protein